MPKTPRGEEWTYYGEKDRRIGATDGVKCWLEDDVVREMSTSGGQKEG